MIASYIFVHLRILEYLSCVGAAKNNVPSYMIGDNTHPQKETTKL